ncbi:hypothetical protein [Paenibacillus sp. KS-LC4]|uniref:hypothetical protein n=1 Tax=Paenibacillus sp. KS-LC4 TaxID=2979727 RepID=UPI0030CDC98A
MTRFRKKMSFLLLCFVIVLPTIASASTNSGDGTVSILDESEFYDAVGNKIEVLEESDGTIVVYINSVLDHSAKTDLTRGTVESTEYIDSTRKQDKHSMTANGKKEKNIDKDKIGMQEKKTIYKIDDLIKEDVFVGSTVDVVEKLEVASLISAAAYDPIYTYPPTWPYNQAYTYRNTYNNDQRQIYAHGYYKNEAPTYTSSQKVSFLRSTSIGVGVSLIVALFSGPVTVAVATGAIIACVGAWILDGYFTKDVDVNVHIKIEWESWLAIVNANSYYVQQGTQYLRVMNQFGPGESTRELGGKVGFVGNFTEFLRQSSWN